MDFVRQNLLDAMPVDRDTAFRTRSHHLVCCHPSALAELPECILILVDACPRVVYQYNCRPFS